MYNKERAFKVLDMIINDMENDINEFEGKIFNATNVAEFNGKQNAAIQALAKIVKKFIEQS